MDLLTTLVYEYRGLVSLILIGLFVVFVVLFGGGLAWAAIQDLLEKALGTKDLHNRVTDLEYRVKALEEAREDDGVWEDDPWPV